MKYVVRIPYNGIIHSYRIFLSKFERVELPGVCILDISSYHVHRYDLQAFFYADKVICSTRSFRSKGELYGAVQELLQKHLNIDVQNASGVCYEKFTGLS